MNNTSAKEAMLKIVREAALKPVFLFYHCGLKEGNQFHRFFIFRHLLFHIINRVAQEAGVNIEVQGDEKT